MHSDIASERPETPDSLRDDLANIRRAAEQATDLTRNLLAFSRRQVSKPVMLDLNEVISGIEAMLRTLVGDRIEFALDLHPEPRAVLADRTQMEQVILNLALNARDAIEDEGSLRIETAEVEVSRGDGHRLEAGNYVALRVADTGCGMDEATREQAFEPFFTTKEMGKGTGLGLSIVYGILRQSGGEVTIESEPGLGTTVSVLLPRIEGDLPSPSEEAPEPRSRARHETILVVEDEPIVRGLIRRVLQEDGYSVIEASDGIDAIEIVAREPRRIDLLLTDLGMPRMGGRELARVLKERDPQLSVLFITGYAPEPLSAEILSEEHLAKPFTGDDLRVRVRELLATPVD